MARLCRLQERFRSVEAIGLLYGRADQSAEKRVRAIGPRTELRVKLRGDKVGVPGISMISTSR